MFIPLPLEVLILEDQPTDAFLIMYELRQAGFEPHWQRVETEADYLASLNSRLDLIIADYSLPQFNAIRALDLLHERGLDIPVIIVSGTIGEDIALDAIGKGAADYLLKDRLARLGEAVKRVLSQKHLGLEKRLAEDRFAKAFRASPTGIAISAVSDGRYLDANDSFLGLVGFQREELIGRSPGDLQIVVDPEFRIKTTQALREQRSLRDLESEVRTRSGDIRQILVSCELIELDGEECILSLVYNITEQRRAEAERIESLIREQKARDRAEQIKFEERDRIAMELHDGIIQSIYAIGMGLEMARTTLVNDPRLDGVLVNSMHDLDSVIDDLRVYIRELKVTNDYPLEFRRQLETLARKFHDACTARLTFDIPAVLMLLTEANVHALVQLVREALSNIARHANATEVQVALRESISEIVMTISDNGDGFDLDAVDMGNGLNNMRQRVQQLNGMVEIMSRPQYGTKLIFKFPPKNALHPD